jgi:DNA invertase Pin-like site-specific DNA recombinase
MRKAISYLRFSSSKQSANDSYRRQIEATEKFCKENGLALSSRLEDLGISAWNKKNLGDDAALGGFLKLVETKEIPRGSVLIVENLDRLSRAKILDAMHLFTSIIKHGIEIVTTMDNKWYSEKSISENPTDLMVSIIYLTRGNNESETKSLRLKASWQNRHAKIANGEFARVHCPSWITKKGDKYVLIKENAEKVKLIFDLYLKGYGANMVIQELIKRGVKSFTKTNKWNLVFIHELLKNPAVIGTYENVGLSIKDYYPRCVSDETYYRALAQRKANNHFLSRTDAKRELNIFAGLCKCHKCGGSVIMYSCKGGKHSKKDKNYKFLICTNARIGQCDYLFTPYEKFNDSFLFVLNTANFAKLLFSGQPVSEDKSPAIKGKIIELEKTIERVTDAVIKSDSPALVSRLTTLEVERKKLERDLADAITANMSKSDVKEDYQFLMDKLNKNLRSNEFRLSLRNLMRKHISEIIVSKEKYVVHFKWSKETITITLNKDDFEVSYWDEVEFYDYFSFKPKEFHPKDAVLYQRKSESY